MNSIKLIALDLDGTALNSERDLTEGTREAIRLAVSNHIQVIFCTGRTIPEMRTLLSVVPEVRYLVCGNGSSVLDLATGKTIYEDKLPYSLQVKILETLAGRDVMLELFSGPDVFVDTSCLQNLASYVFDSFQKVVRESRTPIPDVRALIHQRRAPADKLHVFFRNEAERQQVWAALAPLGLKISSSLQNNMEINSATADKGKGLFQLCQHLGLPAESTMAIGDNNNDYTMMSFAGLSVAMDNAIDDIKKMADAVTKSNDEDGVAFAIRQYALSSCN